MPRQSNKKTGAEGELETAAYLARLGYRLVDSNVRPLTGMARGEIDLIAWHGETLVFIEVKTRYSAHGLQGTPSEAVDRRKRTQLVSLAGAYIAKHDFDDVPIRFDVVEVIEHGSGKRAFSILPNAFDAADAD